MFWETLSAPNPPCARSSHQLSSLGSVLYLFGGESGPPNSHFGYGNPVDSTAVACLNLERPADGWTEVPVRKGSPPSPRLGHGQCVTVDEEGEGFLYVFGGRQPESPGDLQNIRSLNDLHRFDRKEGTWERLEGTGDTPSARSYHQMVAVGGTLFLLAGMVNNDRYNDLFSYSIKEGKWTRLPPAPMEGRGGPGLCVIGEGDDASLIVVAGFCGRPMTDVYQYRIKAGEWLPRPDWALPVARSIFACGVLASDRAGASVNICVFGGELENYDAALIDQGQDPTLKASMYTNQTLLIQDAGPGGATVCVADPGQPPAARGWTSGCSVVMNGKTCFAVFGGVREGVEGEPSGVRLGDLHVLHF